MPNWCENEVRIQAEDRGKAEAFVNFVKDGDNYFSFNKIIPMPDELQGTCSPTRIVSQEEYDNFKLSKDEKFFGVGKPITQEMSDKFNKEYGYDNWYDWTNANWGTKWGVDCPDVHIGDFGEVRYNFDTAWSPPQPIYDALTELFPKLTISWFYREDGMQTAGWLS